MFLNLRATSPGRQKARPWGSGRAGGDLTGGGPLGPRSSVAGGWIHRFGRGITAGVRHRGHTRAIKSIVARARRRRSPAEAMPRARAERSFPVRSRHIERPTIRGRTQARHARLACSICSAGRWGAHDDCSYDLDTRTKSDGLDRDQSDRPGRKCGPLRIKGALRPVLVVLRGRKAGQTRPLI